jgi:hypothetical protein
MPALTSPSITSRKRAENQQEPGHLPHSRAHCTILHANNSMLRMLPTGASAQPSCSWPAAGHLHARTSGQQPQLQALHSLSERACHATSRGLHQERHAPLLASACRTGSAALVQRWLLRSRGLLEPRLGPLHRCWLLSVHPLGYACSPVAVLQACRVHSFIQAALYPSSALHPFRQGAFSLRCAAPLHRTYSHVPPLSGLPHLEHHLAPQATIRCPAHLHPGLLHPFTRPAP